MSDAVITMRKGMSFTLTLLIVALVLLAVGITIITLGQNSIGSVGDIFRSNTDNSEVDLARQNCNQERQRICRQRSLELWLHGGISWAQQASHEGRSCYAWAEEEQIFGVGGTSRIPSCEQEPTQNEKIEACADTIREICSSASDSTDWVGNATHSDSTPSTSFSTSYPESCSGFGVGDYPSFSDGTCGSVN